MTPRLLFFSNLFPTAAEPYRGLDNATLLHAFAAAFAIRVISPRPMLPWVRPRFEPRPEDASLQPRWVRCAYLPKIGSPVNHLLMAASLRHHFEQTLRDFRPDVVLGSWIYPDCCAALHLLHGRVPLVAIAQGSDLHQYLPIPSRRRIILKYLVHAAAVVTRSGALSQLLERESFPPGKLRTVYNGVSLEMFQPRDQLDARRACSLPESARIILFVGNFYEVKNPDHLISAMSLLKTPGTLLVMAGGGPLEKTCRTLATNLHLESRVIFAGRKTPREIATLMNAADLLAIPSENEGVPNVILESFASGLPVVASRVGGIPEVLDHDFLGKMFPPGEVFALAESIDRQLAAPRNPAVIRAHGERFAWPAAASQYRKILLECGFP